MDSRLRDLAGKLDAGLIARREFLRNAAVITGGTAAGLQALKGIAGAQSATKAATTSAITPRRAMTGRANRCIAF